MRPLAHLAPALLLLAGCTVLRPPAPREAAAEPARPVRAGVEVQAYPAGVILALQGRRALTESDDLLFRVGYNATRRRDFGKHDDERGGGPGVGVGWRRSFSPRGEDGWLSGARLDLWSLGIDWKDDPSSTFPAGRKGESDVLVLQPTAELGYGWSVGPGRIELVLALGLEINVRTSGEAVGEGPIGLLGLTWIP